MNQQLSYKGYLGSIVPDLEEGNLHGRLLFIADVVSYGGATVPEIRMAFEAAVDDYLATCKELGVPPDVPCKGSFNVRIGPELHLLATLSARKDELSLNEWVKRACERELSPVVEHKSTKFVVHIDQSTFRDLNDEECSNGAPVFDADPGLGVFSWRPQSESKPTNKH